MSSFGREFIPILLLRPFILISGRECKSPIDCYRFRMGGGEIEGDFYFLNPGL